VGRFGKNLSIFTRESERLREEGSLMLQSAAADFSFKHSKQESHQEIPPALTDRVHYFPTLIGALVRKAARRTPLRKD